LALGAKACADFHIRPSPFLNRKILMDPLGEYGKPLYKEARQILGYFKKRLAKRMKKIKK
jgi:hypothetical protein